VTGWHASGAIDRRCRSVAAAVGVRVAHPNLRRCDAQRYRDGCGLKSKQQKLSFRSLDGPKETAAPRTRPAAWGTLRFSRARGTAPTRHPAAAARAAMLSAAEGQERQQRTAKAKSSNRAAFRLGRRSRLLLFSTSPYACAEHRRTRRKQSACSAERGRDAEAFIVATGCRVDEARLGRGAQGIRAAGAGEGVLSVGSLSLHAQSKGTRPTGRNTPIQNQPPSAWREPAAARAAYRPLSPSPPEQ
jgi:hypothetical protein